MQRRPARFVQNQRRSNRIGCHSECPSHSRNGHRNSPRNEDSGNRISRVVRQVQAFQKRGVAIHYIVLFTIIGALTVLFVLATVGAHLTWIPTLYLNRRFFAQPGERRAKPDVNTFKEAL
jgi:hypothetical protein